MICYLVTYQTVTAATAWILFPWTSDCTYPHPHSSRRHSSHRWLEKQRFGEPNISFINCILMTVGINYHLPKSKKCVRLLWRHWRSQHATRALSVDDNHKKWRADQRIKQPAAAAERAFIFTKTAIRTATMYLPWPMLSQRNLSSASFRQMRHETQFQRLSVRWSPVSQEPMHLLTSAVLFLQSEVWGKGETSGPIYNSSVQSTNRIASFLSDTAPHKSSANVRCCCIGACAVTLRNVTHNTMTYSFVCRWNYLSY